MDVVNWPHTFLSDFLSPFWQIIGCWALMCLLLRLGKFGSVFRVYNTLFHELGHGLLSLGTSGKVHRIELFSDAAGVAVTSSKGWFSCFMVSIAGYPFGAVTGWFMLTQLRHVNNEYMAYIVLGVYTLSLLLWVRNKYGIIWLLANIALVASAVYFRQFHWSSVYFFVVGSFILIESVWSCLILLYLSAENPRDAGDATDLRDLTYLPAILWALFFTIVSLFFVNLSLESILSWKIL